MGGHFRHFKSHVIARLEPYKRGVPQFKLKAADRLGTF